MQGMAVPPVVVVGKGERRHLMLPRELESSVTFHPWLKYQVCVSKREQGKEACRTVSAMRCDAVCARE